MVTALSTPGTIISLSKLYGKSKGIAVANFNINSGKTNFDVRPYLITNGWDGVSKAQIVIGTNVDIIASSTGNYAMTITGSFPNGIKVYNYGRILGAGGAGGTGAYVYGSLYGAGGGGGGGPAFYSNTPVEIYNNGIIAGGGGGGGGGDVTVMYG